MEHNLSAYTNHGCRCDICRDAQREAGRRYRARVKAGEFGPDRERQRLDRINEHARATRAGEHGPEAQQRAREKAHRGYARRQPRVRAALDALKGSPCVDCGGTFPPECMDFDHRPGEEKVKPVGNMYQMSMKNIKAEIEKCDLVCANCHRIRTWRTRMGKDAYEQ